MSDGSQTPSEALRLIGCGVWYPGASSVQELLAGPAKAPDPDKAPAGESIEKRSRRRATLLSRAMADACAEAMAQAQLDPSQVATVFASALGEAPTMISVMDDMCRGEPMSPMRFATSVHSAASGVVSISNKNRAFTTSISADFDSVAAGLLEAWGLVHTGQEPVVLVCGDDVAPADFVSEDDAFGRVAVALALAPQQYAGPAPTLAWIGMPRIGSGNELPSEPADAVGQGAAVAAAADPVAPAQLDAASANSPVVGALDLVCAVGQGRLGRLRLDRGRGSGYCVRLLPGEGS